MKFLIVRFSSIGDIVLTSPVVRCLKQQVKDAEIHYLTKKKFSSLLESNPYLDKLYTIEKNVSESRYALAIGMKKENYDFIIDLHHNLRSAQVKLLLQKKSFSLRKLNIEKYLLVNFRINKLPSVHIVDRYFETVKNLGVKNDGKGLEYFIQKKDHVDLKTLPKEFQNGYIGFIIGAKHFTKQLPAKKIISIIKRINQPVILLGGNEDFEKGETVAQIINLCYNACGKYNINQSASLVKQAKKIITHDTGLMHIAAAFKKEIVSVWGNTIPEFGMSPYYGDSEIKNLKLEIRNLKCRPCTKLGFSKCPKSHFRCMNEIDEEEILRFVLNNH